MALGILHEIFSQKIGKVFSGKGRRVILGHFIAVLLSVATASRNRQNMLCSVELLENVCSFVQDAETLSCFLPGITGGVHQLICSKSDLKRGTKVLCAAISLWNTIIGLTISNRVNKYVDGTAFRNKTVDINSMKSLFQKYGLFRSGRDIEVTKDRKDKKEMNGSQNVSGQIHNKSIISINRNKSWLYETTAKLSIVASTILKTMNSLNYTQSQNRYKLQLKIIELASTVIIDCSDTMSATCQDDFLEIVLQFSISSISDVVDKKARAILHDAKQIFKSKPLNANLWGRIEKRFENCLKEMSKNVSVDVDEDTLKRRIQTLIAYVDLLQDRLEENLFTMMTFKNALFHLSKLFKPDFARINNRIRQPLKKYDNNVVVISNNAKTDVAIGHYDIPLKYMKNKETKMKHIPYFQISADMLMPECC